MNLFDFLFRKKKQEPFLFDEIQLKEAKAKVSHLKLEDFTIITSIGIKQTLQKMNVTNVILRDIQYYCLHDDLIRAFVPLYDKMKFKYIPAIRDCDDFSLDYLAMFSRFLLEIYPLSELPFAIGMSIGRFDNLMELHQNNIYFNAEGEICLYESQKGVIKKYKKDYFLYKIYI